MGSQFSPFPLCRLMALLVATLVGPSTSSIAAICRTSSRVVQPSSLGKIRTLSSSTLAGSTSMSLNRHGYTTRRLGGAPGKGGRRSGGGGHGGGGYRHGSSRGNGGGKRSPTAASARGRRSAFGEERTTGTEARRWGGGGWIDAGGTGGLVGSGGGGAGSDRAVGKAKGEFGRQYKTRRSGGTFAAKATTSGNLMGAPQKWDFKKVDLSVLSRPLHEGNPKVNGGGKRRGALPAAALTPDAPPKTRSRGVKRSMEYAGLSVYSSHFTDLVSLELRHEKERAYERMLTWSNSELANSGYAVQGLIGACVGRLYREHVVRFSRPPRRRDNKIRGQAVRRPPMPFHRFTAGDVIAITPGSKPPSPDVMENGDVVDAVVLQRMPHFLDVVVKVVPEGLANTSPNGYVRMGGATSQFRLDQFVNGVSYDRMLQALRTATAPQTLSVCPIIRGLVVDSLTPTLNRIDEIERRGGLGPGVGDSVLPPGFRPPDEEWAKLVLGHGKGPTPECGKGNVAEVVAGVASEAGLSKRQTQAIRQALESRVTLIQGPPGTGKTKTACNLILSAVKLRTKKGWRSDGKVMATAFSNVAADNLLEGVLNLGMKAVRVGRPATIRPELWPATLDALVESHKDVVSAKGKVQALTSEPDRSESCEGSSDEGVGNGNDSTQPEQQRSRPSRPSPNTSSRQAYSDLESAQQKAAREILRDVDVVVCSCIGAGNDAFVSAIGGDQDSGFSSIRFSTVVIDEATQATEAAALVPIVRGCEQLVLVGDQNQLPPTVLCPEAQAGGFGTSMFARLMHVGLKPILLDKQYRMHPAIADFSSLHFYGGQVTSGMRPSDRPIPQGFPWPNPATPVAFVRICDSIPGSPENVITAAEAAQAIDEGYVNNENRDGGNWRPRRGVGLRGQLERKGGSEAAAPGTWSAASAEYGTSYCNDREANAVAAALEMILAAGDVEAEDVGIITPYSAQVRLLQDVVGSSRRSAAAAAAAAAAAPTATDSDYSDSEERFSSRTQGDRKSVKLPEIASVDGYQGREKEVILLSAVRSNYGGRVGFLADWRRLNVAITRARRGVVVVGDPDTLRRDPHWRAFMQWCDRHRAVMEENGLRGGAAKEIDPFA